MSTLSEAIRTERWDIAALVLLNALMETVLTIPEDAIPQMLEILEGTDDEQQR